MRGLWQVMAILVALALPARAGEPQIEATITAQLDAFRAHDVPGAFAYASPAIKGMFGSAETFGAMVEQGYPMIWQPGPAEMLELRAVAGNLWQKVRITDQGGTSHLLDYMMVETPDGWRINAVQILPEPDVDA